MRVKRIDKEFDGGLKQLYRRDLETGLRRNTHAARRHEDYGAEGVQSWFDCNREEDTLVGGDRHVTTREELEAYDPDLAQVVAEVFRHSGRLDWRYERYAERAPQ